MEFFDSNLADAFTRKAAFCVLERAVSLSRHFALDLVRRSGLTTWLRLQCLPALQNHITDTSVSDIMLPNVIKLLHTIATKARGTEEGPIIMDELSLLVETLFSITTSLQPRRVDDPASNIRTFTILSDIVDIFTAIKRSASSRPVFPINQLTSLVEITTASSLKKLGPNVLNLIFTMRFTPCRTPLEAENRARLLTKSLGVFERLDFNIDRADSLTKFLIAHTRYVMTC